MIGAIVSRLGLSRFLGERIIKFPSATGQYFIRQIIADALTVVQKFDLQHKTLIHIADDCAHNKHTLTSTTPRQSSCMETGRWSISQRRLLLLLLLLLLN